MSRIISPLRFLSIACLLVWSHEGRADSTIGSTTIVVRSVTGTHEGQTQRLRFMDEVYRDESIETSDESATEITFLDSTQLSLGPGTRVTLDRFVYDPDPANSEFVLTIIQGAIRFASGNLPSSAYKIYTPVASVVVPFWAVAQAWPHVIYITVEASGRTVVRCSGNLCQTVDCSGHAERMTTSDPYVLREESPGACVTQAATAREAVAFDQAQQQITDILLATEGPIPGGSDTPAPSQSPIPDSAEESLAAEAPEPDGENQAAAPESRVPSGDEAPSPVPGAPLGEDAGATPVSEIPMADAGRGPLGEVDTEFLFHREANQAQTLGESQSISPMTLVP